MNNESRSPLISIVIPCLNEAESIPVVIPRILNLKRHMNLEVLVIDDNSTDNSRELLKQYPDVKVIKNDGNPGYGGALKKGFSLAQGQYISFIDLDRTYNPEDLEVLFNEISKKDLSIVFGNRMSNKNGMPIVRFLGNFFYATVLQMLFFVRLQDACTGFRLFKRDLIPEVLKIQENGLNFSIAFTVLVVKRKWPFSQIPILYDERIGESKLSVVSDGFLFLKSIFVNSFRS